MKLYLAALLLLLLGSARAAPESPGPSGLSCVREMPREWSFSDARSGPPNEVETALGKIFTDRGSDEKITAAALLWQLHSFRYASKIMEMAADPLASGVSSKTLKTMVDASLAPVAMLHELREGEDRWALWLAYLRPDPALNEELLKHLKDSTAPSPALLLAVGKTRDPAAVPLLLPLLGSQDAPTRGFAAIALGLLGPAGTEPALIAALSDPSPFVQANACSALAAMGTVQALSDLQKIASQKGRMGVINTRRAADSAIRQILKRTPPQGR